MTQRGRPLVLATFAGAALIMRRRAGNPELLASAGCSTQAAVRRALRDGRTNDARIDALTREAARHQLYLLRA